MKNKSLIYKIILVLVLVVICFIMIYIGRGHTLYFDSKSMEVDGVTINPPYRIQVNVKGKEVADLKDGDRGMAIWIGPKAHIELVVTKEKGVGKENIKYDVPLPRKYDGVVINLVGLLNNAKYDEYISEFVPLATATSDSEEEVVIDDMGELGFGE
ncbi:MAG: hypothetical protein IKP66_10260 [Lachnospiraceae bacterium]|nr:hypothetical protein [Lachnospiraceae bacterium]